MKAPLVIGVAALVAASSVAWSFGATEPAGRVKAESVPLTRGAPSGAFVVATPTSPSAVARSPETARLEQRRVLYETVDSLLEASEFERARALLDEEQERHGDEVAPEWRDLAQGYRLIADCLEKPNAKHRARGEAFLLVNEAQAVTAKLRAACAPR